MRKQQFSSVSMLRINKIVNSEIYNITILRLLETYHNSDHKISLEKKIVDHREDHHHLVILLICGSRFCLDSRNFVFLILDQLEIE